MRKLRLLIPITVQFSIRYIVRTGLLEQISEYAQPVILMRWQDAELQEELEQLGAEVHQLPTPEFGLKYYRIRGMLDVLHLKRLRSPSTEIDRRRINLQTPLEQRLRREARYTLYSFLVSLPGIPDWLRQKERELVWQDTNIRSFVSLIEQLDGDAIFTLTPFFRHEQLLLLAGQAANLTLCTAIASFDNITTRGWIPVIFACYMLWNRYNEAELYRAYPEATDERVEIVGAPQFDFYWDHSYVWNEKEWRQRLGLPAHRPVILFGAGHHLIVPHEPHWLKQIDEAISSGEIRGNPIILFRRHPNDPIDRWLPVLERSSNVVPDEPWSPGESGIAYTNIRRGDIERLTSTLYHSAVHVNASSTMTVDGAIFDRPQIGLAYDDTDGNKYDQIVKDLYVREHYLPITESGGLDVAYSRQEMVDAINRGFDEPGQRAAGRQQLVQEICTFTDGRATDRVSDALKDIICSTRDEEFDCAPEAQSEEYATSAKGTS